MADLSEASPGREVTVVWARGSGAPTGAQLLRAEVGRFVGNAAAEVGVSRCCRQCGSSEHGQPVVLLRGGQSRPFVSLSRTGDTVLVAVSACGPVGVDIEPLDAPRFAGFDEVALHEREVAPTIEARAVTWVRKESLLKAAGVGLDVDPRLVRLSDPDTPPRLLEWPAPGKPQGTAWMRDVDVEGHAACVTVLCDEPPGVTVRQAAPEALSR